MSELGFKEVASKITPIDAELTIQDLAILAAEHGYAVVPVEPSEVMFRAAFADMNRTPSGTWKTLKSAKLSPRLIFVAKMAPRYRAMIEAGRIK